jgi:hypothetical protein
VYFWAGYYLYKSEIEQRLKVENIEIPSDSLLDDNNERSRLLKGDETHLL